MTDARTVARAVAQSAGDPVGLTDARTVAVASSRVVADTVAVTDAVAATAGTDHTVADVVGLSDAVAVTRTVASAPADAVGISDAASGAAGSPLSDDFNRADAADLGADWTPIAGGMRIDTNTAYAGTLGSTAGVLHRERWDGGALAGPNMAVQGTIAELSTGGYSDLRLMARWTGSTSFYELRVNNSGEWYINRVTSGGETDITSGTGLTLALPEVWRLEAEGAGATVTLRVYRAGSLIATYADTAGSRITTGDTAGIGGFTAAGSPPDIRLDDWSLTAIDAGAEYTKTPADPVGVTDAATRAVAAARSTPDPIDVTDARAVARTVARTAADSVGVTDSVAADLTAGGTDYTRAPADPIGVTDSAARAVAYVRTVADTVGVTDTGDPQTIDIDWDLADAVGATDSATRTAAAVRARNDAIGITDAATPSVGGGANITRTQADAVGLTDTATRVLAGARARNDAVGLVDTVVVVRSTARTVADPVPITDVAFVPGAEPWSWYLRRSGAWLPATAKLDGVHPATADVT